MFENGAKDKTQNSLKMEINLSLFLICLEFIFISFANVFHDMSLKTCLSQRFQSVNFSLHYRDKDKNVLGIVTSVFSVYWSNVQTSKDTSKGILILLITFLGFCAMEYMQMTVRFSSNDVNGLIRVQKKLQISFLNGLMIT